MRFCQFEDPKMIVKLGKRPTKYIKGHSARHLTSMQGHTAGTILGLADSGMGLEIRTQFEIAEQDGRYCVGIKAMKVLWLALPTVYLASDYKKGSCEYTAVLAHEQIHIRRNNQFISEYAPRFKKEVGKISKQMRTQIGPIGENQIQAAQTELENQMYERLINQFFDRYIPELNRRQSKVDSPEEYAKVFAKCKNWGF
ncbi:MAG: hypothetical protein KDI46_07815 [Alphaproteobacteria bacterium]|nr:hypothetical protein [Alphaproteobacteria bacterium]